VPDKRFWWLRLKALVELRDWESLEKFAKVRKRQRKEKIIQKKTKEDKKTTKKKAMKRIEAEEMKRCLTVIK
jgi:hypothetical protein